MVKCLNRRILSCRLTEFGCVIDTTYEILLAGEKIIFAVVVEEGIEVRIKFKKFRKLKNKNKNVTRVSILDCSIGQSIHITSEFLFNHKSMFETIFSF